MSQLGMMVIAVGLSSYNVALFHLVNHAFTDLFSACSSSLIHFQWTERRILKDKAPGSPLEQPSPRGAFSPALR
ncbi:uncharacterized protein H6S33_008832 [Morchella sextelata]|uniref:uncharacterized protein n=1 Tax=Morchella sextelata TaxID=1174677 RepID=UPI001D03BC26|nr:uncharacterized protein H6S33_008832 [Morchella sextelata]KAH0602357.1 hypothetical protein H6S33_008832 [Morchella sextelata]